MQPQKVHLIGIGGAGLSAIATVLLEQGHIVSGSDLLASPTTERLARLGATVHIGHAPANLGDADVVVVSSAVPADNPELVEAQRRGIPVVKRAEWLGHMMAGKRGVGVAGTHGKTTTSAMIALILREAGLEPSFIVGGDIPQLGTNAAAGEGDVFVIEADEYDHTFLGLRPEIAVVTVVEWDHPDCYPTPESMQGAFQRFLARVPPEGLVVACGDEPTVRELVGRMEEWKNGWMDSRPADPGREKTERPGTPRMVTYGLNSGNDWRAFDLRPNTYGGYDFSVSTNLPISQPSNLPTFQSSTSIPGAHNVKNGLAALIVAHALGVPLDQATAALADFKGVGRRFEVKGQAGGITVVDDYAHHPTEIRATLAAARASYLGRGVWAVFQPHTFSRTRALLDDFATAFGDADHVLIVDIFPAREVDDGSVTSRDILARMNHPDARYVGSLKDATDYLADHLSPGDLLITLGAGDGYRVGKMVMQRMSNREYSA
jgi:UDP-N-acetylmuramate--alanine ligase